jgi:hypothetical protein
VGAANYVPRFSVLMQARNGAVKRLGYRFVTFGKMEGVGNGHDARAATIMRFT